MKDMNQKTVESNLSEIVIFKPLLEELTLMNRTIVSDDMDRAVELIDKAAGLPGKRYQYPSGSEYGSWMVPLSWNVREAYLSDGKNIIASHKDHPLFLAPYSGAFEGWISKEELLEHTFICQRFDDAFAYQHRLACDYQRRLKNWEISLPNNIISQLTADRYYLKIDTNVHPGSMNVLEYAVKGKESATVGILAHLCHPGQANDGISGVIAGITLLHRLAAGRPRFTYKLLIMPELFGSAIHIIAQQLTRNDMAYAIFLETMGTGERLFFKSSRTGREQIDFAIQSLARENSEIGMLGFLEGYGNDELQFDFPNVAIPSVGVQYHPFPEYHTSRDSASIIDWSKMDKAVSWTQELFRRMELNRMIQLKYPGPPHLTRYSLYRDAVTDRKRFLENAKILSLCDDRHTLFDICDQLHLPFDQVADFFAVLDQNELLLPPDEKDYPKGK